MTRTRRHDASHRLRLLLLNWRLLLNVVGCPDLPIMSPVLAPVIASRLEDLCNAIATDPFVISAREEAEKFLGDEQAVALYRDVMTMGRNLEERHRKGQKIPQDDIARFQDLQDKADAHEGIRAFNAAQEVLQDIAMQVNGFVAKTLEKGRVPTTDEVFGNGGGCGEGCGCHH